MLKMRENFQAYADRIDSEIDIIRVEKHTYVLFYVSDNAFADGNRFPEFLTALRALTIIAESYFGTLKILTEIL